MIARSAAGRLLTQLDYEGDTDPGDEPVAHLEGPEGLTVCGADPGDEPGGLDCPACHALVLDAEGDPVLNAQGDDLPLGVVG